MRENLIKAGTNRWKRIASHCFSQSVMQMHNYYVILYSIPLLCLYSTISHCHRKQAMPDVCQSVSGSCEKQTEIRNKPKWRKGERERERLKGYPSHRINELIHYHTIRIYRYGKTCLFFAAFTTNTSTRQAQKQIKSIKTLLKILRNLSVL